jgi:hypothetical protein
MSLRKKKSFGPKPRVPVCRPGLSFDFSADSSIAIRNSPVSFALNLSTAC